MSSPFPTVDPITRAQEWHRFVLKGLDSPGTIPKGGVKGFKRETGWDIKKGKGTAGATLTVKEVPPVTGSFTLQLFTEQDFKDWDRFASEVLLLDASLQQSSGLSVYYPSFGGIALTTVVVHWFTPPMHQGKGLYHAEVALIEWSQPPPVNITSTPATTAPDEPDGGNVGPPPDPRIAQRQAQIALRQQAAKTQ
jgi:hypothetical protein